MKPNKNIIVSLLLVYVAMALAGVILYTYEELSDDNNLASNDFNKVLLKSFAISLGVAIVIIIANYRRIFHPKK